MKNKITGRELLEFLKNKGMICIDRINELMPATLCQEKELYITVAWMLKLSRRPIPLWKAAIGGKMSDEEFDMWCKQVEDVLDKYGIEVLRIREYNGVMGDAIMELRYKDFRYFVHLVRESEKNENDENQNEEEI